MNCPECDAELNIPEDAAVGERLFPVAIAELTMKFQRKMVLQLKSRKRKQ